MPSDDSQPWARSSGPAWKESPQHEGKLRLSPGLPDRLPQPLTHGPPRTVRAAKQTPHVHRCLCSNDTPKARCPATARRVPPPWLHTDRSSGTATLQASLACGSVQLLAARTAREQVSAGLGPGAPLQDPRCAGQRGGGAPQALAKTRPQLCTGPCSDRGPGSPAGARTAVSGLVRGRRAPHHAGPEPGGSAPHRGRVIRADPRPLQADIAPRAPPNLPRAHGHLAGRQPRARPRRRGARGLPRLPAPALIGGAEQDGARPAPAPTCLPAPACPQPLPAPAWPRPVSPASAAGPAPR